MPNADTAKAYSFESWHRLALLLLSGCFLYLFLFNAWISDDIVITFRTVVNFINGYGMAWNPGERVMPFTHPTWFFIISLCYLLSGSLYYSTIILSFISSFIAYFITVRYSKTWISIILAASLLLSRAFIDYTTSGLENPFSYLLFSLMLVLFYKKSFRYSFFFICGLIFLTRFDFALILLPACLFSLFSKQTKWKFIYPSLLLVVGWLVFSTLYFGHPFPNSYLAKLNNSYPLSQYLERGISYCMYSFECDTITICCLALGILLPFFKPGRFLCISCGLAFYFLYILYVGGDFMGGRFFAVPLFVAVFSVILMLNEYKSSLLNSIVIILLCFPLLYSFSKLPVIAGFKYPVTIWKFVIGDERAYYYDRYGLMSKQREWPAVDYTSKQDIIYFSGIGVHGLKNMNTYLIDTVALGSPYLSRIPPLKNDNWRTGHHHRIIPINFEQFVLGGEPDFKNELVNQYFRDIRTVATGSLFSTERIAAIYRINTPSDALKKALQDFTSLRYLYDYTSLSIVPYSQITNNNGFIAFDSRIDIPLHGRVAPKAFSVRVESDDTYYIVIKSDDFEEYLLSNQQKTEYVEYRVTRENASPIDSITIIGYKGNREYGLSGLTLYDLLGNEIPWSP